MSAPSDAIREPFRFDVARLREASLRLDQVNEDLARVRAKLRRRALELAQAAQDLDGSEPGRVSLLSAKAHAVAELARQASLRELPSKRRSGLAFVAAMATSRWLEQLHQLRSGPMGSTAVRSHVETGRVAYRILCTLRRKSGMVTGLGQLSSAVVVAEFAHEADQGWVEEQIYSGLKRGLQVRSLGSEEEVIRAASLALREAAALLTRIAARAEPAVRDILAQVDRVEDEIDQRFSEVG